MPEARPRVVLLHGQPGSGPVWKRVVAAIDATFEVVAPDRPGYGRNPRPAGGVAENVDWLAGLLDRDHRSPAVVVAHSWAGGPALDLARRRPDAIHALVLVASVGPGAVNRTDRLLARPVLGRMAALVTSRRGDGDRGRIRRRSLAQTFLVEQRALIAELPGVLDGLGRVATPTVVVAGTRDRVVPFATAEALAARLPNAELLAVPGARHQLPRTHPGVIADAVHRALADVTQR